MTTQSMMLLATTIHQADTLSPEDLLLQAEQVQATLATTRLGTAQQAAQRLTQTAGRASSALNTTAARVQTANARQAAALRVTADVLTVVAGTTSNILTATSRGVPLLDALLDTRNVKGLSQALGLPGLLDALTVAKHVVTLSRNPNMYNAVGLLSSLTTQVAKHTKNPLAIIARDVILPVVTTALQAHEQAQISTQMAFVNGLSNLQRSAQTASSTFSARAKTAAASSSSTLLLAAAQVMGALATSCQRVLAAVQSGVPQEEALSDVQYVARTPAPLTPAQAQLALKFAAGAQDKDSTTAVARTLATLASIEGRSGIRLDQHVLLPVMAAAAREGDQSGGKYLVGALQCASKVLLARRSYLLAQEVQHADTGA